MRAIRLAALVVLLCPSAGCLVLRKDYDQTVADAASARAAAEAVHADDVARERDLQQRLTITEAAIQDRDARLADLATAVHNVQAQLDEATAITQQLRGELVRLGKDADKLLTERGTLSRALDDARTRLEELRRAQAAAEARATLFRDLELRFRSLIDAGQLRVEWRRGQPVMNVSSDLLFEPGRSEVRAAGKGALMEISVSLKKASEGGSRRFLVTAHVDDDPGKGKPPRSPLELTAARSVAAVEYLVSLGVPASSLVAAEAGALDPLGPNDTPEHRARNRRIELALIPAVEIAPPLPGPAPPRP